MLTNQKTVLSALVVCVLALTAVGQSNAVKVSDWRQDIDEIVKDIRLLHPDPFTKTGKLTFLREVEALKAALPALTEEQRVVRAMRLVASLGDGHTQLESDNSAFAYWYPVRLYEFTDGFFVTSAHKSVAELAGAQVLEAAGRSINEVVAEARKLMGAENTFDSKERLYAVHSAGLMTGLGYAASNGELKVKFKLRNGQVIERVLTPSKSESATFGWTSRTEMFGLPFGTDEDWVSAYKGLPASAFQKEDRSRPPHLTYRGEFVARPMPEQNAYYIQANQVSDNIVRSFQKAMQEVDQIKPRRLIVDWRYNEGGDGSTISFVIQEFIKRANNKPWQELYLLTGRKTFSAAVMALEAFLKFTQLTIVGEPTGAALNHFGDATERNYSRTGLRLRVSTLRWQLSASNDLSEFIAVDVPAPFSFADYAAGRDPAVDPILRGDEMRSLPVIALSDGGVAVRKAYEDRQVRFTKYDWWAPPREIDLKRACQALRDQRRVADALETCKLNAEIYPYNWSPWLNLGIAQRRAGLMLEQVQSFRRVLEIDPNNFNKDVLLPAIAEGLLPNVVRYGATVADMQTRLASSCQTMNTRRIEQPFLPDVKDKQMQIDCEGFQFLGKLRRAEFVFRDDSLEMIWILTTAEEQSLILKAMMDAANGAPTHRNDKYIAFTNNRTALRLDRPEVLFYSEKLAPHIQTWFK